MSKPETIPQYFLERVRQYDRDKVALRQKELGIWREFTWQDSLTQVQSITLGLLALGLKRGDHVCTIGDNDRQYLWAYIGLQSIGAAQVGIFTDAPAHEVAYIVEHSDATYVLAKDQEQCDKLLEIRQQIPNVQRVIYWDDQGLWDYNESWLMSFQDVQKIGRELLEKEPDRFENEVAAGRGKDIAVLCYTSGTTGHPKGAILNHHNLLASSRYLETVDPQYDTDNHVSLLSLGWIAEHVLGMAAHVYHGVIMNFPEEPETVRENVREIAPEGILYNSRLWDALVSTVQVRMNEATWLNRKLYDLFLPVGYRMAEAHLQNQSPGFITNLIYQLGNILLFAPIRDQLGLSRIRFAYTAGSALSPNAVRFFHALGVNLKQIYGSTEVAGGITLHRDGDIKFASVGKAVPGVDIRIADNGEIEIKSDATFQGYYKNQAATDEVFIIDPTGNKWFRTGDAGYIDDDGHLIYLDRIKDMITLANGCSFSPQFIESRLKFNPYIQDVMAIGGITRHTVAALVIIDYENSGQWAERRGIGYTTFADLSQKPEIYQLVQEAIVEVNESLPPDGRVQRFVLMHKEFDADEAEMTRTRKLRRGFLMDRYHEIIKAMYDNREAVSVQSPVRYQDGREGLLETEIRIMDVALK